MATLSPVETEVAGATTPLRDVPPVARRLLLVATYSCSILAVTVPQLLYPAMVAEGILTPAEASAVLGFQTAGVVLGKVLSGMLVDAAGGRATAVLVYCCVGVLCIVLSFASTGWVVATVAFCMEVCNTPAWPAHALIIGGWFPKHLISDGFWLLSMASRGSNMIAGLLYGGLLHVLHWRSVLRVASCVSAIGVILGLLHRDTPARRTVTRPVTFTTLVNGFRGVLTAPQFWTAGASMATVTIVKRFGQVMPVFFYSQASAVLDKASASEVAIVFQAGLASSALFGGYAYGRLSKRGKVWLCAILVAASVVGCASLALWVDPAKSESAVIGKAGLVWLVAAGVGTSFYLPPGIFSVQFGGAERTGLVSAMNDMVGYGSSAIFLIAMRPVIEAGDERDEGFGVGWSAVWLCVGAAGVLALVTGVRFQRMLHKDDDDAAVAAARKHGTTQYTMLEVPDLGSEGIDGAREAIDVATADSE